jgi:hypothetical protein
VGFVIRAKIAPAGRFTSDTEREAKEPGECSTRRRRARSGWTQAGIRLLDEEMIVWVEATIDLFVPFVDEGLELVMADGDILGAMAYCEMDVRSFCNSHIEILAAWLRQLNTNSRNERVYIVLQHSRLNSQSHVSIDIASSLLWV